MKKILSIVLSVFIGVTAIWAEEYTVTNYNHEGNATQYKETFNTNATKNGKKYVTMEVSDGAGMNNSYIQPAPSGGTDVSKCVELKAYTGCYIRSYKVKLGSKSDLDLGLGTQDPVVLRVNDEPEYSEQGWLVKRFKEWTKYDKLKTVQSTDPVPLEIDKYDKDAVKIYVGRVLNHTPDLRDIGVTIWVPEVLTEQPDGRSSYVITEKPMLKGGTTNTYSITYDVANGINDADFEATVKMTGGKGQVRVTNWTFSNSKQELTVYFLYEAAASEDWECESYTADLVISSVNEFNTNTFTTTINGSGAGNVKSNNTLAWAFTSPQFVNAPLATLTIDKNNPNPVTYKSYNEEYAKFETKDGITTLKLLKATPAGQTVLLTAHQDEYTDAKGGGVKEATIQMNIAIKKRTPEFTFNPEGELYTSRTYNKYVSPRAGNDPNGTMHPTYSSEDADLFVVDASGNLTTKAGIDTKKLHIVVASSDEWEAYDQPHYVTVARDPRHVPWCLNDELFNNTAFITSVTGSGAVYEYTSGNLRLGNERGLDFSGKTYTKTVEMTFTGIPNILKITRVDMQDYGTQNLTIQQYYNGNWQSVDGGTITADASNLSLPLNKDATKLQFSYNGVGVVSISGICVSERVDLAVEPETLTLTKVAGAITPLSFIASYSNMTEGTITINAVVLSADQFTISCNAHAPAQSLTLGYADGLGVDQNPEIPISVAYVGALEDIDSSLKDQVVATITVYATNGESEVTKMVNLKIDVKEEIEMIDGVPSIILPANANPAEIWTGTNISSNTFPYHTKRQLNLSRCFDANTGTALFDILYIFGITTNTSDKDDINAPTDLLECNAKTPCYVYQKGAMGDRYVYHETFDAASKCFDHGTTMSGKHLYFTGYCPFAYVGTTKDENGWMYFQGKTGVSDQVDIYLDSCQIYARLKTPNGNHGVYNNYDLVISIEQIGAAENQINYNYLSGYSSPFVFTSGTKNSGTSFRPTIHIAGKNHVKGQLGSLIHNTIADVTPVLGALGSLAGDVTKINLGISGVNTYSAPIAVKPTDVGQYTDLTMTDIWKDNTITNGYIRLDAADVLGKVSETALSIDLGSATGSLTINGGQYHMRNAAADGNYTCNLAVGYKMYPRSEQALGATLQVRLYGFGDDQTDSKVTINSGTFTMYKNMYALPTGDLLGTDYYKDQTNFLDLRLPAGKGNSRINGGTFNGISNVVTCKSTISTGADPMNEAENWLTLWDVPVTGTNPDGSAQFSIDDIKDIQYAYPAEPRVTYTLVNDIENVKNASQYGGQSANAYKKTIDGVEKDVVTLLLPGDLFGLPEKSEVQLRNWVTAVPYLEASKKLAGLVDASLIQGGPIDVEVSSLSENIKYENKQLIFADLEGLEGYQYTIPAQGAGMRIKENENAFGQINNTDSYEITNHLNLLKVVQADTWYTFTAPFDVHEISVIEANNASYNESTIAATNTNDRANAMKLQAEANLHFMYGIYTFIIPNEDGRASSLSFDEMLGQSYVLQNKQKLIHYNGKNLMDAHYYLYELDSLDTNGHFSTNGTGDALNIDWKPVNRKADEPLLKKGQTYAMQFPWCPMCNDLDSRTKYDYWSNKMILFYGQGPQTIDGINSHSAILSAPAEGTAKLTGNSTFADMTLAAKTGYVHITTTDYFEQKNDSYPLKPTEGFLLYNPGAKPMPARISRTGQIEYDENAETGVDGGVPTVGDRTSLMLFGAYDGFEVLALHEQLVTVYNLQGNIIFQQYMTAGEQVYVATGAGIYVVRGESEAIKVMIE